MLMSHDPSTDIMPASRTAGGFRRTIDEIEDETGLETKVEAGADSIKIELKRGAKMVGYFRASTVSPDSFQWKEAPLDCKEAWSQIGEPPVWVVRGAEWFDPDLRGKGFGKLLYKALFSYIASKKGVVGPNRCSGGNTSPDAQRVWRSLHSMYPKHGPLIDLRKMASASRVASRYLNARGDYPKAGGSVNGLRVKGNAPNQGSISASFNDYEVLPDVREVPVSDFKAAPHEMFAASGDLRKVEELAEAIEHNGWITPLIVVLDDDPKPYILEGAHRLAALHTLGKRTFPALVVRDLDL